ncbi:MAG: sulfur carrier protein ThiS adenylyltransferase ThiF [Chitinispirillaceae bacterium]|nr:sulfur carrier protein ThiS adenylyltransferase ThiF [Chitinispirillaceae bacterium]
MEDFSFSKVTAAYFTPAQAEALEKVTIGIAGAGGIGSNCALMLVRSGFSRFTLVDFDTVFPSNLNRQAYNRNHIGKKKVECLHQLCIAINSYAEITAYAARIDSGNIMQLFDNCDVIIEAFDDAGSKALLFTSYLNSGKLLVGVSGIAGIGNTDRIGIREIRENCFIVGDEVTGVSETVKPYAPRVMVAAAKMADIVLEKVLCGFSTG